MKLMLDTSVLVEICVPGRYPAAKEWFRNLLLSSSPPTLLVSALADYELRRALQHMAATRSLEHYDEVLKGLTVVPVSAESTRRASTLSGPPQQLSDADAIIAAQALIEGAVLVTSDSALKGVPDLEVRNWKEIDPATAKSAS